MENELFLIIGGNLGSREKHLAFAIEQLSKNVGNIHITSGIYESAAWGLRKQPDFLNQVLGIKTDLMPKEVLNEIQIIEKAAGRTRSERWGARNLDIDILFYGDLVLKTKELTLPHPRIEERNFVLVPLAEVASDFIHPVLNKSISRLLEESPDSLSVKSWNPQEENKK